MRVLRRREGGREGCVVGWLTIVEGGKMEMRGRSSWMRWGGKGRLSR